MWGPTDEGTMQGNYIPKSSNKSNQLYISTSLDTQMGQSIRKILLWSWSQVSKGGGTDYLLFRESQGSQFICSGSDTFWKVTSLSVTIKNQKCAVLCTRQLQIISQCYGYGLCDL